MKVRVNRRHLLAAVKTARAFQTRELAKDQPVYAAVDLRADAGGLVVASAGASWSLEADVAAEVESDGSALVPAAQLAAVLAAVRATDVNLIVRDPYRLAVDAGAGCATLADLRESGNANLPPWPFSADGGQRSLIDIPVPTLRRVLGRVLHANDPERPQAAICLGVRRDALVAEATDGYRLIQVRVAIGRGPAMPEVIYLEHELAARLAALKTDCMARLLECDGHLLLSMSDGARIAFRSLELTAWPKTDPLLAAVRDGHATVVDRARLLAVVQAATAFDAPLVLRRVRGSAFVGLVASQVTWMGSGVQEDLAANLENEVAEATVRVSPAYLLDALSAIETSEVRLFSPARHDGVLGVEPVLLECSAERQLELIAQRKGDGALETSMATESEPADPDTRAAACADAAQKFLDGPGAGGPVESVEISVPGATPVRVAQRKKSSSSTPRRKR